LIRSVLLCVTLLVAGATSRAAGQGQLDASPTLFTVLAAINAAGYDADLDSPSTHPLRLAVRNEIASRNLPVVQQLKLFYNMHWQRDSTAVLSQYISFALSVDGPPNFKYRFRTVDLPPDVAPLEGLPDLMARFYRDARIEDLWKKAQPAFEEAIARYHEPVTQAVFQVNAYLRNPTRGYLGRRFQIYLDLLGAPNQIQARSYADDYFIVLTASPEPQVDDVRHAYLHYLLDPLGIKYGDALLKKRGLGDFALAAPALPDYYKNDFVLLATESLIKAVESRLASGSAARKQEMVSEALREGYILTPFFAEQLPLFEKQEADMRQYFPEMIKAMDLRKEDARLANVQFAEHVKVRRAKEAPVRRPAPLTGAAKTMEEAERLYTARDLDKARQAYMQALQETTENPVHAKAYYGLARIAVLEKNPELAEKLFRKTLELSPEPYVKGWTLVYLGRLADAAGEREQATSYYKDALAVDGASAAARQAAQKGIEQTFRK
jgi:tetratricopeptide (TPR) repeat protein